MAREVNKNQPILSKKQGFSLREIAVGLFRHKLLIFITLLTTAVAATAFVLLTPDYYQSRMKILVRNMRADTPVTAGAERVADKNEVSEGEITSEIELLKSRDLLEQVVRKLNLAEPQVEGAAVTEQDIERAVYKLEKELDASPVKKANIIEVSYSSKSPKTAASVLNEIAALYMDKHLKLHRPPGAYQFFKDQADQYEKELRSTENQLSNFQQKRDVVAINQQKELTLTRLADSKSKLKELNGTIQETDKRIVELEKQLGGIEKRVKTQNRVLPNQYSAERLNTMLVELKNRRTQLLTKFQPNDRVVKEVDDQIATTSTALVEAVKSTSVEESSDINPLRQTFESELSRAKIDQAGRIALRKNLEEQVVQYMAQIENLEEATPIHDDLARQVKKKEETYQLYAKKQEESRISDALDEQKISNVSIAEAPIVPRTPNKQNRLLALIASLGVGLGLILGSVFVSELLRDTFHTPRELESYTEFPVLATIPLNPNNQLFEQFEPGESDTGEEELIYEFEDQNVNSYINVFRDGGNIEKRKI